MVVLLKRLLLLLGLALIVAYAAWSVVPGSDVTGRGGQIVDLHVHAAGIGAGDSGAFINDAMRNSYKFGIYLRAMGVTQAELEAEGDRVLLRKLSERIRASERVSDAVILAMDGALQADGTVDRNRTQLYVPNDYLAEELAAYPNLHFGASINPLRADALARLDQVAADGAVLVKWIPNIMHFDPADPALTPFYRRMAELNLPLLSHTGQERSFADADDRFGDPQRLALPLSLGVTVIAAHIATTGASDGQSNYERILPMLREYPNLYVDISSLTQINKRNYLAAALREAGLHQRMVYGSDWPLQFFPLVSPLFHLNHIKLADAKAVQAARSQWDRDVILKEQMGVPATVFARTAELLKIAPTP
ncbi:MAG: amidohydrolase family protein [Pseudomonadota bacterium]